MTDSQTEQLIKHPLNDVFQWESELCVKKEKLTNVHPCASELFLVVKVYASVCQ